MKWCRLGLCAGLHPLICFAAFDVGLYVPFELWPPVLVEYELLCLLDAWMAGKDVIVTVRNDFASQRGFLRNVDMSVILQKSSFMGDPLFMIEGCGNSFIPQFLLSGGFFYFLKRFTGHGHNESPEVERLEDDNVIIILLALIMVIPSREEICLLVKHPGLVLECEMVLRQLCHLARLSLVQLLQFPEVLEVLMICPDFYILSCPHEVMPPFQKGEHNGEELLVIYFIVMFCHRESL